jgi:hypothetical protein
MSLVLHHPRGEALANEGEFAFEDFRSRGSEIEVVRLTTSENVTDSSADEPEVTGSVHLLEE